MAGATDENAEDGRQAVADRTVSIDDENMADGDHYMVSEGDDDGVAVGDPSSDRDNDAASAEEYVESEIVLTMSEHEDSSTTDDGSPEDIQTKNLASRLPSFSEQALSSDEEDFRGEATSFPSSRDIKLQFSFKEEELCDSTGLRLSKKHYKFHRGFQARLCRYMVNSHYFHVEEAGLCLSTLDPFYHEYNLLNDRKDVRARAFFIHEIRTLAGKITMQVIKDDGYTRELRGVPEALREILKYKRGYEYIGELQDWDGVMRRKFLDLPDMQRAVLLLTRQENLEVQGYLREALLGSNLNPSSPLIQTPTSGRHPKQHGPGAGAETLLTPSSTPSKKRPVPAYDQGEGASGKRANLSREKTTK